MKKGLLYLAVVIFSVCTLGACKEEDDTYDAYANWPARNAEYFAQIAAEARDSIARAKGQYGERWEEHCNWRMFKSTTKSQNAAGALTDSICVLNSGVRGRKVRHGPTRSVSITGAI